MALFGASGGAEQALTIVIKARNEALGQLQQTQQQLEKFKKTNSDILSMTQKSSGIATAALGALGIAAIKAGAEMEQTRISFNTMLGSAQRGGAFIKDLYDFAKRTPFDVRGVEDAGKKLLAYGLEASEVIPTLESLGNVASGVGQDKFPQLVYAYGQVRAANKLYGTELRQFTETGVPLIDALAQHFGVASSEIRNMVEEGKVGFEDVKIALNSLSEEGGMFAGLMEKQSQSLTGMVTRLGETWTLFLRSQGGQFVGFAKAVVGGLTSILEKVQAWSEANPRLSSTIFMVAAGGSALVFALSSMALVLPKVLAFFATGLKVLTATNPVLLAIGAAVGIVMWKLLEFADEVGGLGRAWQLTVLQMEINFWKFVRGTLNGMNTLIQYIPFLNDAMGGAIDNVNGKLDEAQVRFDALAVEGFAAAANNADSMGDTAADAFNKIGVAATGASEEARKAAEQIAEVEKQVTELQKSFLEDLVDAKKDYAEAYVEQEEKVHDLRKEIRKLEKSEDSDSNASRLRELKDQYEKEKQALSDTSFVKTQLEAEVVEARRRNALTDYQREMEDIARRVVARQTEFNDKMLSLQKEIEAHRQKASEIQTAEIGTTTVVGKEVALREKTTIDSVNRQIKAYEQLAEASTLGKKSFDFGFATANSTPAYRGYSNGGTIDGPLGSPRMIMAHGGERVLPIGHNGKGGGGGDTYVVNINNPVVRKREDVTQLRQDMERAWRDISRVHKLSTL